MTCYPCPKQDRAEALAADSRRQVDAAWARLRHVYLAAHDAGLDIGEESLRAHFLESYVDNEYASRVSDALAAFHSWTVTNLHMLTAAIEDGKLDLVIGTGPAARTVELRLQPVVLAFEVGGGWGRMHGGRNDCASRQGGGQRYAFHSFLRLPVNGYRSILLMFLRRGGARRHGPAF